MDIGWAAEEEDVGTSMMSALIQKPQFGSHSCLRCFVGVFCWRRASEGIKGQTKEKEEHRDESQTFPYYEVSYRCR